MRRWRRRLASTPSSLVGLLATSGTIESGVYAEATERAGVKIIVPDAAHQLLVMEAIYGATGVKAGFTEGKCREDLRKALIHLAQGGAGVIVLGCTELPLLFPQTSEFDADGSTIALLDPTMLLAAACVRHARAARTPARACPQLGDSQGASAMLHGRSA